MNEFHIKANVVINLTDGFSRNHFLQGVVSVYTDTGIYAKKKAPGCYVFSNCPKETYNIIIDAPKYQKQQLKVQVDDNIKAFDITLNPNRTYYFDEAVTKIYGKSGKKAYIGIPFSKKEFRIISNTGKIEENTTEVTAYYPENINLKEKKIYVKNKELVSIYNVNIDKYGSRILELTPALTDEINEDTTIGIIQEIVPGEDEYFICMKGKRDSILIFDDIESADNKISFKETEFERNEINIDF